MSGNSKIMVVDDDTFSLDLLRQELEHLGHEIITCTNGQNALEKIVSKSCKHGFPGVIITDIRMPRMDGIELMKRAKDLDPDLPIILITAYGEIAMAVQALWNITEANVAAVKLVGQYCV